MIVGLQQGLKADGIEVSLVKLCRWFGIARRTVYYRATKGHPKLQEQFCHADQSHDQAELFVWLPHDGVFTELQHEHGAAGVSGQGLASAQTPGGFQAQHPGATVSGKGPRRTLGNGLVPDLDWKGWLVAFGRGQSQQSLLCGIETAEPAWPD